MLITYSKTLERNTQVNIGDEAEVYVDRHVKWVTVLRICDNGAIYCVDGLDNQIRFENKDRFFEAIGDA